MNSQASDLASGDDVSAAMATPSSNGRLTNSSAKDAGIPAISLRALSRTFGQIKALDGVSMEIPTGSVFGLLGPNGSGKTTLLSVLCGFLKPTSGGLTLFGRPVTEGLSRVGAIAGESSVP